MIYLMSSQDKIIKFQELKLAYIKNGAICY